MQSRRRFFCARVELVQLARAFLCPAPPQPTAAPPGRSPQGTPPGYSIPAAPGQSHAGTLDRVQLRDSRPQYHSPQPDSPARVQSLHSRHRGRTEPRNRARVHEYRQAPPQATEPPTGRKAGNARKSPGQPHRATQRRRGCKNARNAAALAPACFTTLKR